MSAGENKVRDDMPLVLLFSPRVRIRSVLAAGLLNANYRILEAETPYVASVKASQYVPDVVLVDITRDNIRDFLFLTRLEQSVRTQEIGVIVSVTADVKEALKAIYDETGAAHGMGAESKVRLIEYPFPFVNLKRAIDEVAAARRQRMRQGTSETGRPSVLGERLFDPAIAISKKLSMITAAIKQQWAYPFTVIKAFDIIGDEHSCSVELARCIESDLAATTAILELANKIDYAKRSGRITKVNEAVTRIGFNETRNILASLLFIDITAEVNQKYGFRRIDFWMHSLSTALLAEMLAANAGHQRPEQAFLAGLIHDIGKIPLDHAFPAVFARILEETTNHMCGFFTIEEQLTGLNHAQLGHHLTTEWNFPSYVTMSILHHHRPEQIIKERIPKDRIVQEAVFCANIFAKALGMGHSCDEVLTMIPAGMLKELHLPAGPPRRFIDEVFARFRRYYDYLNVGSEKLVYREPAHETRAEAILVVLGSGVTYHPCLLALSTAGYRVSTCEVLPANLNPAVKVIVFLPEKGAPLDITITENGEAEAGGAACLRLYLLDDLCMPDAKREFNESNMIIMDRSNLDTRLLLHVIEDYCFSVQMQAMNPPVP